MNLETLLLRQAHPDFSPNGELSSQAFYPFRKDGGRLSVYDNDKISVIDSFNHYTEQLRLESSGVWGVSCAEVNEIGLTNLSDPLPESPAHALIDFGIKVEKEYRKLAKRLKGFALKRDCLYSRT